MNTKKLVDKVYLMRKDGVSISMSWDELEEMVGPKAMKKFRGSGMYQKHLANKKLKDFEDCDSEVCEACGYRSVESQWSGVACQNPDCNYTFCL